MIQLTAQTPILLACQPVDFRKQFDGLIALCTHQLALDPRSGVRFVFINRARTMIRVLTYDGSGYWLATKRLSQGRFTQWPSAPHQTAALDAKAFMNLLRTTDCQAKPIAVSYHANDEVKNGS